jgi:hypothetical protein
MRRDMPCRRCGLKQAQYPRWLCRRCDIAVGTFVPVGASGRRVCRRCGQCEVQRESLCAVCLGHALADQTAAAAVAPAPAVVPVRERRIGTRTYEVVWDGTTREPEPPGGLWPELVAAELDKGRR